jgi:hypothetical protein
MLEANYYRLAYQLAAQRANHAVASDAGAPSPLEVAAGAKGRADIAIGEVERLSARVQTTIEYLGKVSEASTWPWYPTLTAKEKRLQLFLISTVRPSVALVLAGLEVQRDPDEAGRIVRELFLRRGGAIVDWAGPLRRAAVTIVPWSHRAYYNLACYATARDVRGPIWVRSRDELLEATGRSRASAPDVPVDVAIWALHQSFRLARDRQRTEAVRWATQDPSLEPLRERDETRDRFKALLARFGATEPVPKRGHSRDG